VQTKPNTMTIKNIKSDVYEIIIGDYYCEYFTEKELIQLIKYNDIADVIKHPLGYVVNTDRGILLPKQYLRLMSESAQELLAISLLNNKTNNYEISNN
jgi:hypothetical protein